MPLLFKTLLADAGLDPEEVIMLRHKLRRGRLDAFTLWRTERAIFEDYQSVQWQKNRSRFRRPIWAAFAAIRGPRTLFLGLYQTENVGPVSAGEHELLSGRTLDPSTRDRYRCTRMAELSDYGGRLCIEWGQGYRQWVQRGEASKEITELSDDYKDPAFPGDLG